MNHFPMKPIIYDYLDAAQFLNAYLDWLKSQRPGFSIAKWADELGFESKVTLRFILKKQRSISPRTIQVLRANLNLNNNEAEYFDSLVIYSQAKTVAERQALGAALMKLQRGQFQQKILPAATAGRHAFTPVILTLLTFSDIVKDVTHIARLLMIEESEAEKVLTDLLNDGLVSQNQDGTYDFKETTFRVTTSAGLRGYYEYWIDRSKRALDLPLEERRYRSLKFALSKEEFEEVVEKINDYSMLLLSKYQASSLEGKRLYMLESALFPISTFVDESKNRTQNPQQLLRDLQPRDGKA